MSSLRIFSAHWLFLITQTTPNPLLEFILLTDIERGNGPFAKNGVYVDKTHFAKKLCQRDGGQYFFVRPRRFGKSTFLRTLQRIFDGSKHVFEGTHIYQSDYNWVPYPILYLDLGDTKEKDCDNVIISKGTRLVEAMQLQLDKFIKIYKLPYNLNKSNDVVSEFVNILLNVNYENGNSTVVLVDEYDLPVLSNMKDCLAAAIINKNHLEDLFQRLKTWSGLIKFAFVTGVSKAVFRMFISPPDLKDITDNPKFHEIAGITDTDLNTVYANHIADIAERKNESNVTGILKHWYDGYQFADGINSRLYSPLSVHGYFESGGVAKPYFDAKGYAEFIFDQMIKRPDAFSILNLEAPVPSTLKGTGDLYTTTADVLLYDAGYFTIQEIVEGQYYLGFPNEEMKQVFHKDIADAALAAKDSTAPEIRLIADSLKKQVPDFHTFMSAVNSALMKLRVRPKYEKWYHYETREFMKQAQIIYTNVETPINTANFGDRKPDITGYDTFTCFLFEVKYEVYLYLAWDQANKSIDTFLRDGTYRLCGGPNKNLLVAGFTFTSNVTEDVLLAYQAKLFAPDGTVLQKYQSKQFADDGSILSEYLGLRASKTDFIFSRDDLFVGSTVTKKPPPTSKKARSRKSGKTTKRTHSSTL